MLLRVSLHSVVKRTRFLLSKLSGVGANAIDSINCGNSAGVSIAGNHIMLETFEEHVFSHMAKRCLSTQGNGQLGQQPMMAQQLADHATTDEAYEEAIKTLNTLQSNADSIRRSIALNSKQNPNDMYNYLRRSGKSLDEVEKLSFIHVSGTKGKGSTCALVEAILRAHGVRTGFFSSPHLVSVCERIRINGEPISQQNFVRAFWPIYRRLQETKEHETDMPSYFKFLTIMCFHVFLEEQVHVGILEVGIGGELDCTNVIRNIKTIGITSLGLEHTQLLGNTLQEIAWQKAGIIKPKARVYTSVTQPVCLDIIRQRAVERNATLNIVPEFNEYIHDDKSKAVLTNLNDVTVLNGSLAIQLAYDWLRNHKNGFHCNYTLNSTELTDKVLEGLINCNWPGRCQMVQLQNFRIHLDGAHTVESMCVCGDWFKKVAGDNHIPKVLIFNITGDRDSKKLLSILHSKSHFDFVCFVPNIATGSANNNDNTSVYSMLEQMKRAKMHVGDWHSLCEEDAEQNNAHVFGSVLDSLNFISKQFGRQQEVDVLVTGSLHLIGAAVIALNKFKVHLEQT